MVNKFSKGDRVKCANDIPKIIFEKSKCAGELGTVLKDAEDGSDFVPVRFDNDVGGHDCDGLCEPGHGRLVPCFALILIQKKNDLPVIVVITDGETTTATMREGKTVVASAKAVCSKNDIFDFGVGARVAFCRLLEKLGLPEQKNPKAEPEYSQARYDLATKICDMGMCSAANSKRKHDCPFKGKNLQCSNYAATHPETQKLMDDYLASEQEPEKPTVREVFRPAKVGEWIRLTNSGGYTFAHKGDIVRVDGLYKESSTVMIHGKQFGYMEPSDGFGWPFLRGNYVVLEGFHG